jgi:hypothetical protein
MKHIFGLVSLYTDTLTASRTCADRSSWVSSLLLPGGVMPPFDHWSRIGYILPSPTPQYSVTAWMAVRGKVTAGGFRMKSIRIGCIEISDESLRSPGGSPAEDSDMRKRQATTCFLTRDGHARSRLAAGLTQLCTGRCSDTLQWFYYAGVSLLPE